MLLTQISMKKKNQTKQKLPLERQTSWSIPLWGILWGKNTVAPALFTCLWGERNPACPGVLCVFVCCHPRPVIGAGGYIVISGPYLGVLPACTARDQPPPWRGYFLLMMKGTGSITSHDTIFRSSGDMCIHGPPPGRPTCGPPLPTVLYRSRVNRMSLSPCPQRASQGLPFNLTPSVLHDQAIVGRLCYPGLLLPPTLPSGKEWALFCELSTCGKVTN